MTTAAVTTASGIRANHYRGPVADFLKEYFQPGSPLSTAEQKHEFIAQSHRTLNARSSKIRNRLLRLTADSPDLLAVIKAEGKA